MREAELASGNYVHELQEAITLRKHYQEVLAENPILYKQRLESIQERINELREWFEWIYSDSDTPSPMLGKEDK